MYETMSASFRYRYRHNIRLIATNKIEPMIENKTDHRYTIEFLRDILKKCISQPPCFFLNHIVSKLLMSAFPGQRKCDCGNKSHSGRLWERPRDTFATRRKVSELRKLGSDRFSASVDFFIFTPMYVMARGRPSTAHSRG